MPEPGAEGGDAVRPVAIERLAETARCAGDDRVASEEPLDFGRARRVARQEAVEALEEPLHLV